MLSNPGVACASIPARMIADALVLPIRAVMETASAQGMVPDRCDILQNGNTLVLRLTETLVARVVTDRDGPRQGTGWFERENAVAMHLACHGAPVIPVHPEFRRALMNISVMRSTSGSSSLPSMPPRNRT
jgi:hypothetical protein